MVLLLRLLTLGPFLSWWVGRIWSWGLLKVSGMRLKVEGLENLAGGRQFIFISNHTSAFDIPVLYWVLPFPLGMLAKIELAYIPFFGWAMWAAGHFFINRRDHGKAVSALTAVAEKLKYLNKRSLVIFPEGTRSLDGRLGRFKMGAFLLSLESGIPIVPVVINGAFQAKSKYEQRINPSVISVQVLPPMDSRHYSYETRHGYRQAALEQFNSAYSFNPD